MDQLSCCGVDALEAPVLDWGVLEQREAAALATPYAALGEAARRRAAQLFSHGEGVAYGAAFEAAFAPAEAVAEAVAAGLREGLRLRRDEPRRSRAATQLWGAVGGGRSSSSSAAAASAAAAFAAAASSSAASSAFLLTRGAAEASIGMHLRHQRTDDDGRKLAGAAACLGQLSARQPRCTVLLAADRNASIAHAPAAFGRLCAVASVAREAAVARGTGLARGAGTPTAGTRVGPPTPTREPPRSEHGPWAGAAVAQDVELLATSTHGFIGAHVLG